MSLLLGKLCIVNILYWRRLEESQLLSICGDAYQTYRLGTWF